MKFSNREVLSQKINEWKKEGLTVGFTSGVFDILHAGHLDYLEKSKTKCNRLVVGINTDQSVKVNKGPKRPIVSEEHRINLVAGLKPVDAVFLFSELNNNENIKILKPNLYIKAGDYQPDQLSSAPLIKALGGEVEIIPVSNDISSSAIIESIESKSICSSSDVEKEKERPVVFLDRDGVINKEISYLHEPEKFELTETCIEGMKKLANLNCAIVVVTNQAGIGLGYFGHEDFYKVNQAMFRALKPTGIKLDKIYYCPHGVGDNCKCRKPKTGMMEKAFADCSLTKKNSFMIGDQETDIDAGKAFGLKTIRITDSDDSKANFKVANFLEAIEIVESTLLN